MKLLNLAFILLTLTNIYAQNDNRIDTDRPDQTDGTQIVKPGEFQVETDLYYNSFSEYDPAVITSTLIRIGALKFAELRVVVEEGIQRDIFIDETAQGVFPLAIGTKVEILKKHKNLPDISLIGTMQVPATSRSSDMQMRWAPFFALAYEKKFGKLSVDVNTGIKGAAFEDKYSYQASSSFRFELTKKFIVFAEYFGQYAPTLIPQHNVDSGFIYYLKENLQICASVGSTLLFEDYNRFVLIGTAFRLPK